MEKLRGEPSDGALGTFDGEDELAAAFASFARLAEQHIDPADTLVEIVKAAVELIPGCTDGSISVVIGRKTMKSQAASSELPAIVDAIQISTGQGPCLDAAYVHETVRVPDMATETRWPLFATRALEAGAAGMLACQLYVDGEDLGALNLFSRTAGGLDEESEHVALMFAAHAAVAFAAAEQKASSARKVATRQLIGRAEGILMERHKVTSEQAFQMLVRVSQHRNTKLRDIAERLVVSGRLDEPRPGTAAIGRA
ncbi:MAG: GAF and ANTAR domain-containing protein [Mycobacteriales bacterium]